MAAVDRSNVVMAADTPVKGSKTYRGFVAGIFSGMAKLSGASHHALPSHPRLV